MRDRCRQDQPPLVSVVIPAYNRATRIRRAIESVLGQTYQNLEIIIVDDGSTDGTSEVVRAIDDPRIRLIRHERNRGGSAARNTGIRASQGRYIAFLDSDDEWLPPKLARQVALFAQSPADLGLVYAGVERVWADGTRSTYVPRTRADARTLLNWNVVGETSAGVVCRTALDATGGFDETLPASQDLDLWLRIAQRFAIDFVPDVLVRVDKGNDRGRISANVEGTIRARRLFCHKHRAEMLDCGVLHRYLRYTGWLCHRALGDVQRARQFYRESLVVNRIAPITYVALAATCVPMWLMEAASAWLRKVSRQPHRELTARFRAGYSKTIRVQGIRAGSPATDDRLP